MHCSKGRHCWGTRQASSDETNSTLCPTMVTPDITATLHPASLICWQGFKSKHSSGKLTLTASYHNILICLTVSLWQKHLWRLKNAINCMNQSAWKTWQLTGKLHLPLFLVTTQPDDFVINQRIPTIEYCVIFVKFGGGDCFVCYSSFFLSFVYELVAYTVIL